MHFEKKKCSSFIFRAICNSDVNIFQVIFQDTNPRM